LAQPKIDSLNTLLEKGDLSRSDSIDVYNNLGYEYWTINPQKSLECGRTALELARRMEAKEKEAFSNRVLGVAYWALGDYLLATQYMLNALELYQQLDDTYGIGSMYMNIGLVHSDHGSREEAKAHFSSGLKIFKELNIRRSEATSYTKLANELTMQDSFDLARSYLHQAIDLHREEGFKYGLAEAYNRLAIVYQQQDEFDASLDYFHRSIEISREINDFEGLAKGYTDMAFTRLEMGDFATAQTNFGKSIDIASEIGSKKWKLKAYRGLAETYERMNEIDSALIYSKKHQELEDSILNEQKVLAMANLYEEHRNKRRLEDLEISKAKIQLLEREAETRSMLILILSLGTLFALAAVFLAIRYYRLRTVQKDMHIENIKLKERELRRDLELSQRELTSYALNFLQKNEFINDLKKELQGAKPTSEILRIRQLLNQANTLDKDWDNFRIQFEKVHGSFGTELLETHPDLTPHELRHCSLIRINLNIKECASILGISPDSAKTSRYRIRKKLKIDTEDSIYDYLLKFGR
jgi:tetratricopeptide (TPR) repeat protein/DNA-binding CsgD family transcriptional regulator